MISCESAIQKNQNKLHDKFPPRLQLISTMNGLLSGILKKTFIPSLSISRCISVTSASRLKQSISIAKLILAFFTNYILHLLVEVNQDEAKQAITIKGTYIKSPNEPLLVKEYTECQKNGQRFCPECTLGLDIKHTDVLILSQYVRADGLMLPRRTTGLCKRQQKRIGTMVTMAQKAGLMINLTPSNCKKDPKKRFGLKKFNRYYFERTIRCDGYN